MVLGKVSKTISVLTLVSFLSLSLFPRYALALPEGERVVAGKANFERNGNTMNIRVKTNRLIAEYNKFNIAGNEAVRFYQPSSSSIALNRVVGIDPSSILGTLSANGKIFLVNPNGILFGAGSRVDTAGLTASTLDISNEDFLAGRYVFYGKGGAVVNEGYISSPGGYVALLGSTVENNGIIEANLGTVALASGEAITLNLDPKGMVSVVVDKGVVENLGGKESAVSNTGTIIAAGGKVILTTKTLNGVFDKAINNAGIIEAKSLVNNKGEVYLLANKDGDSIVSNTGTIDVSAKDKKANGGFVELSGGILDFVNGTIDNSSKYGKTGAILFDPWDILIGPLEAWWLENHTYGNVTLAADHDIYLRILDDKLNLKYYDSGEFFRLEAGHDIDLGDNAIVTNGADIELYADYDKNDNGTIFWNKTLWSWNGGLKSNGGDIILSGADVDMRRQNIFGQEKIADIDAGSGTVYFTPSVEGKQVNWTKDWQLDPSTFTLAVQGLEKIKAGRIVIGKDKNPGVIAGDIRIDDTLDLLSDGDCDDLQLFSRGNIYSNTPDTDIRVSSLLSDAGSNIGSLGNPLKTEVNDLWAYARNGDVYVNELDGINLIDVQALGSAVDITTSGLTYVYNVIATGAIDPAVVNLTNTGGSTIINGVVAALSNAWDAVINISATENLVAINSSLISSSSNTGLAYNGLSAGNSIGIFDGSRVFAGATSGAAINSLSAVDSILLDNSASVYALSQNNLAVNNLTASNNVILDNDSLVAANSVSNTGANNLNAVGNVIIDNGSEVQAVSQTGQAVNNLGADNNVIVTNGGLVYAYASNGALAANNILAGNDIIVANSANIFAYTIVQALNNLTAGNDITLDNNSTISAYAQGQASNLLQAGNNIVIKDSSAVNAYAQNDIAGNVFISGNDIIVSQNSAVIASNVNSLAENFLLAGNNIVLRRGSVVGAYSEHNTARNYLRANDIILRRYATISAIGNVALNDLGAFDDIRLSRHSNLWAHADNLAVNALDAGDRIILNTDSNISAYSHNQAANFLDAGGNLVVRGSSSINAYAENGMATNLLIAGNNLRVGPTSLVFAHSDDSLAANLLLAGNNILANHIEAYSVNSVAAIGMFAIGNIVAKDILAGAGVASIVALGSLFGDIDAQSITAYGGTLGSAILAIAGNGDINLGNLTANVVAALAFGLDGDSNITSSGTVTANYLGLLARNNIGTSANPIQTNVDNLFAYSFGTGDIYVNEADNIQLGFDIPNIPTGAPVFGFLTTILGMPALPNPLQDLPVKANNGSVYVNAGGNIGVYDVQASDRVTLHAAGAITDENGNSEKPYDIIATQLSLTAANGIGSGNALDTRVSELQATNTSAGNIEIENTGDLHLVDLDGLGYSIKNFGPGDINIGAHSNISIDSAIFGSGLVSLSASEAIIDNNNIGYDIVAPDLVLNAGTGIGSGNALETQVSSLQATSTTGNIEVTNDSPELTLWDLLAGDGIIRIINSGDMKIRLVKASHGGVYLESSLGSMYAIPVAGFNVIASGYSYFSTPNGTIGVGSLLNPFDNPLFVDIGVVGGAPSALPAGYVLPASYGSTTPGLVLNIGGVAYPDFTGPNGAIGLSGVIAGKVTPGGVAVTGVSPAPGIDIAAGGPPGYVFYDHIMGPGFQQIWPELPPSMDLSTILAEPLNKYLRAYYEILRAHRVVAAEPISPTTFYFYHPLTPTDYSAFDKIALDVGAYEFIDGNLSFKNTESLSPYYEQVKAENK